MPDYPDTKDFEHASRALAALESKLAEFDKEQSDLNQELTGRQTKLQGTEAQLDQAYKALDEPTVTKLEGTIEKLKAGVQRFTRILSARGESPERADLEQQIRVAQLAVGDAHEAWWNSVEETFGALAVAPLATAVIAARAIGFTDARTYTASRPFQDALHAAVAKLDQSAEYPVPRERPFTVAAVSKITRPDRETERSVAREERTRREAGGHIRGHSFGVSN